MRKISIVGLGTACVVAVLPSVGAAAIQAPTFVQGNDYGQRSAVVSYPLPTSSDEGPLVGPTICLPVQGSTFALGTTAVDCTSLADGGELCIPICIPLPDIPVAGGFDVRVKIVRCTLAGDAGANDLAGTSERDWICGRGGADALTGANGANTLVGGGGGDRDRIKGGDGRDDVKAGSGTDTVRVRDGLRDTISCGSGNDLVIADNRDTVAGNCERVRLG